MVPHSAIAWSVDPIVSSGTHPPAPPPLLLLLLALSDAAASCAPRWLLLLPTAFGLLHFLGLLAHLVPAVLVGAIISSLATLPLALLSAPTSVAPVAAAALVSTPLHARLPPPALLLLLLLPAQSSGPLPSPRASIGKCSGWWMAMRPSSAGLEGAAKAAAATAAAGDMMSESAAWGHGGGRGGKSTTARLKTSYLQCW